MSTVSGASGGVQYDWTQYNAGKKDTKTQVEQSQDRFLTLMVSQMKNQDPLNPMDNAQVTQQMAQISTVTELTTLNKSFQGLADTFNAGQSLQAAGMIGRNILGAGNSITLDKGTGKAGYELPSNADKVELAVIDKDGNVVHTEDLGAQKAGVHTFEWDGTNDALGKAADGEYTFQVVAQSGGTDVKAEPLAIGKVESVALGSGSMKISAGALGSITMDKIKQIL